MTTRQEKAQIVSCLRDESTSERKSEEVLRTSDTTGCGLSAFAFQLFPSLFIWTVFCSFFCCAHALGRIFGACGGFFGSPGLNGRCDRCRRCQTLPTPSGKAPAYCLRTFYFRSSSFAKRLNIEMLSQRRTISGRFISETVQLIGEELLENFLHSFIFSTLVARFSFLRKSNFCLFHKI